MTAYSPVGMNPDEFGVIPNYKEIHLLTMIFSLKIKQALIMTSLVSD